MIYPRQRRFAMTAAIPLLCVGVWIAFNSSYPEIPGTCLALLWWAFVFALSAKKSR